MSNNELIVNSNVAFYVTDVARARLQTIEMPLWERPQVIVIYKNGGSDQLYCESDAEARHLFSRITDGMGGE